MLNKLVKFLNKAFLILLLLCLALYLSIAYFYKDAFMINTWINGIYCTGKSVDEVNAELLFQTKAPFLTIISPEGKTEQINMSDFSYKEDYRKSLQECIEKQNSLLWPIYSVRKNEMNIQKECSWDEESLLEALKNMKIVQEQIPSELSVAIVMGEQGYELSDNLYGVLEPGIFADYVHSNLGNGILVSKMSESNAYLDKEPDESQKAVRIMWNELQEFLQCDITYDMGTEKILLDKSITSAFVKVDENGEFLLDENGEFQVDEEGIEAFIDQLALEYNTVDTNLQFQASRGEVVEVPYITYGTKLNDKAEKEYLKEAFKNRVSEVHIPEYTKEGYIRGKDDIGDTFIEVDMTEQKLYCHKAGEIILETDIVTGNMRRKWNTPEGVNFVYAKQKKRVLRGPGYATPVDFWMPVKGSIGLHDADWRKEFGGDIYLTNGSHGCVNIPPEVMPTVYEEYEIGTPVIMFY